MIPIQSLVLIAMRSPPTLSLRRVLAVAVPTAAVVAAAVSYVLATGFTR